MVYPKYNHYLIFNRISYDKYHIKDFLTEEEWEMSTLYAHFLKALDGKTDPYDICSDQISEDEVKLILEHMKEEGFIEDIEGPMPLGVGSILIPLWTPKITKYHRLFGALWNKILMIMWLPILILGVCVLLNYNWEWGDNGYSVFWGYLLGLGLGLLFHELSHAFACIGYSSKNHFFEMGVMIHNFLPGAYVIIDYSEMRDRFKRAQVNAAGVECNIALCGLFLCCLKFGAIDSGMLLMAAHLNLILAVFNTTLLDGIDGMGIYSELLGVDQLVDKAMNLSFNFKKKKELRKRGINGKATIACCYIVIIFQLLLPIILIMNLVSIVSAFIF